MWTNPILLNKLVILLYLAGCAYSAKYEIIFENENIFDDCEPTLKPPGAQNINGVLDISKVDFKFRKGALNVSGVITTVWDIQPTDRVAVNAKVYKYHRGTWQPTLLSVAQNDFCKVFYKKGELWYDNWTQHIVRTDESLCIDKPGNELPLKPYELKILFPNVLHNNLAGLYKVVVHFVAFDKSNVKRKNPICFEIRGEYVKI